MTLVCNQMIRKLTELIKIFNPEKSGGSVECLVPGGLDWSGADCLVPHFEFLCSCSRPVYVSAVRPQSKHIVVMVDHGASITDSQLQIARDSALVILNSIDEHDKVCKKKQTFLCLIRKLLFYTLLWKIRKFIHLGEIALSLCRSPSCLWQRRSAPALWTSATRACYLRPLARLRGR